MLSLSWSLKLPYIWLVGDSQAWKFRNRTEQQFTWIPTASHRSLPPGSLHSQGSPLLVGRVGEGPGNKGKWWGVVLLLQIPHNTPCLSLPLNFVKTIIFASGRTVYSKWISNKIQHGKFGRQIACKYSSLSTTLLAARELLPNRVFYRGFENSQYSIIHLVCPPKFCILSSIVFNFCCQQNFKTKGNARSFFWGGGGVLWGM